MLWLARVEKLEIPQVWKFDSWLPRVIAKEKCYSTIGSSRHLWWSVCSNYANVDSESTLNLFKVQRERLKKLGLWEIYLERLKVLPIVYGMKNRGITLNYDRLEELYSTYTEKSAQAGCVCINVAKSFGVALELPKSGNNKSLTEFVFGPLGLKSHKRSKKTGKPSMDKSVLEEWEATLPKHSKALAFVRALKGKRKRDTALSYLEGYERFWLELRDTTEGRRTDDKAGVWRVLHPSLNPTGTDTLRWSSSNPNEQNISKQEGFNLRYCFGPAPGREWWSLDAKNIELRIPAYEAGETEMIDLFENEDREPYYGSYHLLIFDTLHPDKFAKHSIDCKKVYESTWYQWTKNGNFAVQYGAVEQSGTADRAYHVPGAQKRIQKRFNKIRKLNELMVKHAQEYGYVETIPDRTIDPKRGYPLLCSRTNYNRVLPTVPLNYHVQGTAMWWMMKAMIRCQEYLDEDNRRYKPAYRAYMVMQVHDELVFDFPKRKPFGNKKDTVSGNLHKIKQIQDLMERGGDDIGIPTPVDIEYHPDNWSEGVSI
jgi:DNA polymerase I-like protein with 3'-5' exonuclease and polymerase domains